MLDYVLVSVVLANGPLCAILLNCVTLWLGGEAKWGILPEYRHKNEHLDTHRNLNQNAQFEVHRMALQKEDDMLC